jgi:hypothetical protein
LSSLFPKRQRKSIEETRRRRIPISLFAAINYFECFSLYCWNKQATRAHRGSFTSLSGPLLLYTTSIDDAMITPKEPLRKALLFWNIFCERKFGSFLPFIKRTKIYDKLLHITQNQNTHRTDCF